MAREATPSWSWITSNWRAKLYASRLCMISRWPPLSICSNGARAKMNERRAWVCESPLANKVTSWPRRTRPSVSKLTTNSMPP